LQPPLGTFYFKSDVADIDRAELSPNAIWYIDPTIMAQEYSKDIKLHYNNNFKKKNILISKHHAKYPADRYAPCWKTFEYYTFSSIVKVYGSVINDKGDLTSTHGCIRVYNSRFKSK